MKLYKVDAVVLRSREMREADRILTLFSRQRGKIRVVAHGVNKPTSRKRGMVQPFCYSTFLINRGRELDSVNQCEGIEAFPGLREDLDKLFYASYIAELIDAVAMEGEVNEQLFALMLIVLHLMAGANTDIELLTRAFEIRLMNISGLSPHLESCVCCGAFVEPETVNFSAGSGGVVCSRCSALVQDVKKFPRSVLEVLRLLLSWDLTKLERIKVPPYTRQHLKRLMQEYLNYHVEKKIVTARFLEQL